MKKIMFNDRFGLTEAVLSGRKTQTRRIIPKSLISLCDMREEHPMFEDSYGDWHHITETRCSYRVGEVVAVAQNYKDCIADCPTPIDEVYYEKRNLAGWANKLFTKPSLLPHQIRIINVRVERLQDISDEDCIKEGVGISRTNNYIGHPFSIPFNYFIGKDEKGSRYSSAREAYAALIDKISGKGVWNSNPWVFVYDFELVK